MNPELSVRNLLSFSWAKTKEILFPFEFKRWIKIFFIVWLSGHAAGWGSNFNVPLKPKPTPVARQAQEQKAQVPSQPSQPSNENDFTWKVGEESGVIRTSPPAQTETDGAKAGFEIPPRLVPLLILAIPIIIVLALLFAWLASRFNFILLDLMVNRDVRIGESFKAHKVLGNSYFLWGLGFLGVLIACFAALAGLFVLAALNKVLLFLLIPLSIAFVIALIVVGILVGEFIPPIMYQEGIRTMEACKRLISFKPHFGQIALYVLLLIGLGILAGLASLVAVVVVGIIAFIIFFLAVFLGGVVAGALPFLKPVLIVLGILGLIGGILGLIVLVGLITLPIPIFFRAFALSYLTRLIPQYNLLGLPPFDSPVSGSSA